MINSDTGKTNSFTAYGHGFDWYDWQAAEHTMRALFKLLPFLETATVRLQCYQTTLEYFLKDHCGFDGLRELSNQGQGTMLSSPDPCPNVKVEVVFLVTSRLFSSWVREDEEDDYDRELNQKWHQDHHPWNEIVFEGRHSSGPYTWRGLDLQVSPDHSRYTFEGVLADIEAKKANRPRTSMRTLQECIEAKHL